MTVKWKQDESEAIIIITKTLELHFIGGYSFIVCARVNLSVKGRQGRCSEKAGVVKINHLFEETNNSQHEDLELRTYFSVSIFITRTENRLLHLILQTLQNIILADVSKT